MTNERAKLFPKIPERLENLQPTGGLTTIAATEP